MTDRKELTNIQLGTPVIITGVVEAVEDGAFNDGSAAYFIRLDDRDSTRGPVLELDAGLFEVKVYAVELLLAERKAHSENFNEPW